MVGARDAALRPTEDPPQDEGSAGADASSSGNVSVALDPEPPQILGRRLIFYRGFEDGSESLFNPATVVVSVGLGFYGHVWQEPLVQNIGSGGAMGRLVEAYVHPLEAVEGRGGWEPFLTSEFVLALIPVHPNFYFHMLGEGMVSRKLEEYYLTRGFSRGVSTTLAISTVVVSQQLNELVEQQSTALTGLSLKAAHHDGPTRRAVDGADSLADTAFWNTAGLIAFQFDGVARAFNNRYLNLVFWPGQAVLDVTDGTLFNQAELYRTAIKLPWTDRLKLSWVGGAPILGAPGLSVRAYRENTFGAAYGIYSRSLSAATLTRATQPDGSLWTQDVSNLTGGLFLHWERHGSLMASLAIRDWKGASFNLYPGTIPLAKVRLGAYFDLEPGEPKAIGLTLASLPVVPGVQW